MTGRAATLVAALCLVLAFAGAPANAAAAKKWPKLLVTSHAGQGWKADLAAPLFPAGHLWVPGESATRRFYARNQSGEKARLVVAVRVADRTAWLRRGQLRMEIAVRGRWQRVVFNGRTGVRSTVVGAGDVVKVKVRVRLLRRANGASMGRSMSFRVALRLTELRR